MLGQISLFQPSLDLPLRQRVSVEIISTADARYMLETFHYLHRSRVGRQINYAILVDGQVDGVITFAYPMMSAPLFDVPADELVEFARMYLHQNIPHTATCAIGKVLKRIKSDWMKLFPDSKEPRLVVSWSDTTLHKGTIYKAANFTWFRKTKGDNRKTPRNNTDSKRGFRKQTDDYSHDKDCWLYGLNNNECKRLSLYSSKQSEHVQIAPKNYQLLAQPAAPVTVPEPEPAMPTAPSPAYNCWLHWPPIDADWRQREDGGWVCNVCHPA